MLTVSLPSIAQMSFNNTYRTTNQLLPKLHSVKDKQVWDINNDKKYQLAKILWLSKPLTPVQPKVKSSCILAFVIPLALSLQKTVDMLKIFGLYSGCRSKDRSKYKI